MLSCECPFEGDDDQPHWYKPEDFVEMPKFSRRKRCADKDCRRLIEPGEPVAIFERVRYPRTDVEENIYGQGEPIPMADHYLCEDCAGLYFSLDELGFCFFYETTRESIREYQQLFSGDSRREE
jgi:hypothetical protein